MITGSDEFAREAAAAGLRTVVDLDEAHEEWGANCGPAALAALLGKSLAEVRPHLGHFEVRGRRFMGPADMEAALQSLKISHRKWQGKAPPTTEAALCHLLWAGPSLTKLSLRVRYRHSHWIAVRRAAGTIWVYDCNVDWMKHNDWRLTVHDYSRSLIAGCSGDWDLNCSIVIDGRHIKR